MTTFQQSDWTATIVAPGTSGTIRKSPDPSSPCEGAGPPDYEILTQSYMCPLFGGFVTLTHIILDKLATTCV